MVKDSTLDNGEDDVDDSNDKYNNMSGCCSVSDDNDIDFDIDE